MEASRLFKKAFIFSALNCSILCGALWFLSGHNRHVHMNNWETESNLLVMGDHERYDVAILGTSRGRVLSRDNNHRLLEKILGRKVINLSKGGGGGLMPAELHLSFFYHRGNFADHIIYLVDPWVFFSAINNEDNDFFLRDEPFELFILWKLIKDRYPSDRILSYLQMIAVRDWEAVSRYAAPGLTEGTLDRVDQEKLIRARQHYLSKYGKVSFKKYSRFVDAINALVKKNNGSITYVMLPLLVPNFPGISQVDRKLRQTAQQNEHVTYHALSHSMQDIQYYYDHMHFNKNGVAYFARNGLSPILNGDTPDM